MSVHRAGADTAGVAWALTRRAFVRDRWFAAAWAALLGAAVYVSARATPWLFPTTADQVRAAESINASPAIVALYGPIRDTHSLGELAMTKMTVLYSVLVALMCVIVVRRHIRRNAASGRSRAVLLSATAEATILAASVGLLAALANVSAGLPVLGSMMFGASWAGIGLVATTLTATICQLPGSFRVRGWMTAAVIGLLYALRALGDSSSATWLGWLTPFGWATRVEAWSTPQIWVLFLYVLAAVGLAVVALDLNAMRDGEVEVIADRSPNGDWLALAVWTIATAGLAGVFGMIIPDVGAVLESSGARELLQRMAGTGPLPGALAGVVFAVVAPVVTAFGISVLSRDTRGADTAPRPGFVAPVLLAVAGSTWLLLVAGSMFALGRVVAGGSADVVYLAAALNHAPAVWTLLGMAAIARSLVPNWPRAGWGLLLLFATLGPFGELAGLPARLVDFSPYSRIAVMPAEAFDPVSAIALTVGSCLLFAVAGWDHHRRREVGTPQLVEIGERRA